MPVAVPALPGIRERLLPGIDLQVMRGLEIGPLSNPRLRKDEAQIRYLDHLPLEELKAKYVGHGLDFDELCDVDLVWSPGQRMREAVGEWGPVDFVIASHVIEHVANPIGWLEQVEESLAPGGALCLVVPDKRYCFDARRRETELAQLIDVYLRGVDVTGFEAIFDFESHFMGTVTAEELWAGLEPQTRIRTDVEEPLRQALDTCLRQRETGEYLDVHATVFTPLSFLDILGQLSQLGLTSFGIRAMFPTERGSYEFFVTLESLAGLDPDARLARQRAGIATAREAVVAYERAVGTLTTSSGAAFPVSAYEQRLLLAKRRTLLALRQAARRLPTRRPR